jgi:hypothetical protein
MKMIEGYSTVNDIARNWNLNPRTVQIMCAEGKIEGRQNLGGRYELSVKGKYT